MGKNVNWNCPYWSNLHRLFNFLLLLSIENVQIEKAKRSKIKTIMAGNARPFKQFK